MRQIYASNSVHTPAVVGPRCCSRHVTAMCCHDKSDMPESLSRYYFASRRLSGGWWLVASRLLERLLLFAIPHPPLKPIRTYIFLIAWSFSLHVPWVGVIGIGGRHYEPASSWIIRARVNSDINAWMRSYLRGETWVGHQTRPLDAPSCVCNREDRPKIVLR